MTEEQYATYLKDLEPGLSAAGIRRIRATELNERQKKFLEQTFSDEISAILTPMAVVSESEFPLVQNQTLNVCVRLSPAPNDDKPRFAIIPFGRSTSRFITLPSDGGYLSILLEDVVGMYADRFFPGEPVQECVPFRITRNADLSIREDLASDLLEEMEEILDARKEGNCVRLEIADHASSALQKFLETALQMCAEEVYASPGPLPARPRVVHAANRPAGFRQSEVRAVAAASFARRRPHRGDLFGSVTSRHSAQSPLRKL
jgi:polyphosphate kinase